MSIELPANVGSGLVEGLFTYSVATGPEPNRDPRAEPAQGTITFTPWPERLLNATATPPMTIITKPIECTLDAEGFLVDPEGDKGVRLIATNDKDLNPHDWTYRVAFSFDDGSRWSINLEVLEDETVDLTTVLPVSGSPGNAVIKGDPGRGVPPGGDDGEVLVKAGGGDHDTAWQDPVLYVDDAVAQAGTYTDSQVSAIDIGAPTVHTHVLTDLTDSTVLGRTLASVEDDVAGREALDLQGRVSASGVGVAGITNQVSNPRGRNTSGTVTVRENLLPTRVLFASGATLLGEVPGGGRLPGIVWEASIPDGPWYISTTGSNAGGPRVTPGKTYTASAWLLSPVGLQIDPRIPWRNEAGSNFRTDADTPQVVPANTPTRVFVTEVAPDTAYTGGIRITGQSPYAPDGTAIQYSGILFEESDTARPFFDGDISPDTDFTAEWTGTPGESTSRLVAPKPVGWNPGWLGAHYYSASRDAHAFTVNKNKPWDESVAYSGGFGTGVGDTNTLIAEVSTDSTTPGATWEIADAPQTGPGPVGITPSAVLRSVGVAEIPSYRLHVKGFSNGETVYFRSAVVPGTYAGKFFDGHTPGAEWDGDPDASVSVWGGNRVVDVNAAQEALRLAQQANRGLAPVTGASPLGILLLRSDQEQAQSALGIEIDTSVGTSIMVGTHYVFYDSGPRSMGEEVVDGTIAATSGLQVRRTTHHVEVLIVNWKPGKVGRSYLLPPLPEGFRSPNTRIFPAAQGGELVELKVPYGSSTSGIYVDSVSAEDFISLTLSFLTNDSPPTGFPGSPA